MGLNTYIGARYVPLIDGEWVGTKNYEPLTVVLYQGSSYTSICSVPTGILPTNTQYWAKTGDYNAQVEKYREEVAVLSNTVNEVTGKVNNLITSVGELTTRVNLLTNKCVIIIGDSYSRGDNPSVRTIGWSHKMCAYLGMTEGTNFFIVDESASGFVNKGLEGHNFQELLEGIVIPVDKTQITDIIVGGGINDYLATDVQIYTAISSFCHYAHSNYPNAKIAMGFMETFLDSDKRSSIPTVIEQMQQCGLFGASYISNSEFIMHNYAYLSTDGLHPTQVGQDNIGAHFASWYLSGDLSVVYNRLSQNITWKGLTCTFGASLTNETVLIDFLGLMGSITATTINSNELIELGDMSPWIVSGMSYYRCSFWTQGIMTVDNGEWVLLPVQIVFNNNKVFFKTALIKNNEAKAFNCTYINILPCSATVSSLYC